MTDRYTKTDRQTKDRERDRHRHRVKLTCTISNSYVRKKIIQRWYNKYKDMKYTKIMALQLIPLATRVLIALF